MVFYKADHEFCLHQACSVQAHQMTEFQNKALILQGMSSLQKFCGKTLRLCSVYCSVMKALKGTVWLKILPFQGYPPACGPLRKERNSICMWIYIFRRGNRRRKGTFISNCVHCWESYSFFMYIEFMFHAHINTEFISAAVKLELRENAPWEATSDTESWERMILWGQEPREEKWKLQSINFSKSGFM